MTTTKDFIIANKDTVKDFLEWLNTNSNLTVILPMPVETIIGYAIKYLATKNLSYICDLHSIIVYYLDPKLVVNILLAKHAETGKFTDIVYELYDINSPDITTSHLKAIEFLLNKLNNPF